MQAGQTAESRIPPFTWTKRKGYNPLTADDEIRLVTAWQRDGDISARNELIEAFMPLAISVVNGVMKKGPNREKRRDAFADMMQEAVIGLAKGADRFNLDRGFRFSTYARWWVMAEVNDYVVNNHSVVRLIVNQDQKRMFFKLGLEMNEIERNLRSEGKYEGLDQVLRIAADNMGLPPDTVRTCYYQSYLGDKSLNLPLNDEDGANEVIDLTPSEDPGPEEQLASSDYARHASQIIEAALQTLSQREREILIKRRLSPDGVMTLDELGKLYAITRERVRQIEVKAMSKVSTYIQRHGSCLKG